MIERILYSNLDRRPDRNEWFLENMELAGVPMELVERVPAKDWRDYDSVEDTVKAMQKDGFALNFPPVGHWARKGLLHPDQRGETAQSWTFSVVLRRIMNDEKRTLFLHDDFCLLSWEDLIGSLECFNDIKFQLIKLHWHVAPEPSPNESFNDIFNYGVYGLSDGAVIYSAAGANRVFALQQGINDALSTVETIIRLHFNNDRCFHPREPEKFCHYFSLERESDASSTSNIGTLH